MNGHVLKVRQKIVLLTCGTLLVALGFIAYTSFYFVDEIMHQEAVKTLDAETEAFKNSAAYEFKDLENNILVLSRTPPFAGLMRTMRNGGIDPVDKSTTQLWRARLGTIFQSFLQNSSFYTQIRLVGVSDSGREIVRVNRSNLGVTMVPKNELQQKNKESYFQQALYLQPNEIAYSDVNYNREKGKIDKAMIPTIRCLFPIFDGNKLFGFIIVNIDYSKFLQSILLRSQPRHHAIIVNNQMDYIEYSPSKGPSIFQMHGYYSKPLPKMLDNFKLKILKEKYLDLNEVIAVPKLLKIDPKNYNVSMYFFLMQSKSAINASALQITYYNLSVLFLIIIVALVVSFILANYILAPLNRMNHSLTQARTDHRKLYLPANLKDEIGDLARAFLGLTRELENEKKNIHKIIDGTADSILAFDAEFKVKFFNQAALRLFGYGYDEMGVQYITSLVPTMESNILDEGIMNELKETHGVHKTGDIIDVEYCINKTIERGETNYVCVLRDITERKKVEKLKSEFISIISHELRTPLTSIFGSLGLIREIGKEQLEGKVKELINISYQNAERLRFLVDDILDLEKIESGKMEYNLQRTNINELIQQNIKSNQAYAEQHQVVFEAKLSAVDYFVKVDPHRFEQALTNFLSNAAKFTKPNMTVQVTTALKNDEWLEVAVIDQGIGISKEFQQELFAKFAQQRESKVAKVKGTGLGLYITKSIIESMGGTIHVESTEGVGSTFSMRFKIC